MTESHPAMRYVRNPKVPVVRNYFARWRLHSTNRWTAVHWFRDALPACGLPEPDGPYDFDLPPEPVITCKRCQRLNREAMVSDAH